MSLTSSGCSNVRTFPWTHLENGTNHSHALRPDVVLLARNNDLSGVQHDVRGYVVTQDSGEAAA